MSKECCTRRWQFHPPLKRAVCYTIMTTSTTTSILTILSYVPVFKRRAWWHCWSKVVFRTFPGISMVCLCGLIKSNGIWLHSRHNIMVLIVTAKWVLLEGVGTWCDIHRDIAKTLWHPCDNPCDVGCDVTKIIYILSVWYSSSVAVKTLSDTETCDTRVIDVTNDSSCSKYV